MMARCPRHVGSLNWLSTQTTLSSLVTRSKPSINAAMVSNTTSKLTMSKVSCTGCSKWYVFRLRFAFSITSSSLRMPGSRRVPFSTNPAVEAGLSAGAFSPASPSASAGASALPSCSSSSSCSASSIGASAVSVRSPCISGGGGQRMSLSRWCAIEASAIKSCNCTTSWLTSSSRNRRLQPSDHVSSMPSKRVIGSWAKTCSTSSLASCFLISSHASAYNAQESLSMAATSASCSSSKAMSGNVADNSSVASPRAHLGSISQSFKFLYACVTTSMTPFTEE
mmetsp:Transcript_57424/g.159832  ORF Transcript_57424/g.159832 Transcript_57424/m.159832 type:complete len:281 (-) Transcript_57424:1334-2176(-)